MEIWSIQVLSGHFRGGLDVTIFDFCQAGPNMEFLCIIGLALSSSAETFVLTYLPIYGMETGARLTNLSAFTADAADPTLL